MKIKNIISIKNYGIFSEYARGTTKDFKNSNIIFGWNYTGKTTLSRIFRSLELKTKSGGYENGKFKIRLEDDTEISEADIETNNLSIRVFNSDYIRENLKWEQLARGIQPILIMGEENIKLRDKLSRLNEELQTTVDIIQKLNEKKDSIVEAIDNRLTSEASRITQELGLGRNFRRPNLETLVRSDRIKQYLLSDSKFSILKTTALSNAKLSSVSEIAIDLNKDITIKTKELLEKTVTPSKTIERLKANQNIEDWVRVGRSLHKAKQKCEFCGNELSQGLLNVLDSHFSLEYENFRKEVSSYLKLVEECTIDVSNKLKSKNDFYIELQNDYSTTKKAVEIDVKKHNEYIKDVAKQVKNKFVKLSYSMKLNPDSSFDFSLIENAVSEFNSVIQKNEERTRNFRKIKQNAIDKLKKHYASHFHFSYKYDLKQAKINTLELELKNKTQSKIDTQLAIKKIENKISESVNGSELLNYYIKRYFGNDTPLEIRGIDNQFHVYRDKKEAENLSEGEKTAISFAYFITTLQDRKTKENINKTIICVDDPISSLDHNHLYNTFSLISGCLKGKCEQLFISTHNFEFYNLLKDDFAWDRFRQRKKCDNRENHNCKCSIYQLNRTRENATIQNVDCLLCRFKSEYQYIFYQLSDFIGTEGEADEYRLYTMPNMLRRFLETYIGFSVPSTKSWSKNLGELIKIDEDLKFVNRLTNEMSHNEDIERTLKLYNTAEIKKAINITFSSFEHDSAKKDYLDSLKTSVGIELN
jgi:wobble nucleotide-excising tRNase